MLSGMSYAQDSKHAASSLPNEARLSFEDAFTITLNQLDSAETYVKKLEFEKAVSDERLSLEKERSNLLEAQLKIKDERLAANEREKQAGAIIEAEKDKQLKINDERIAKLEKKKGGGFFKGFGVGFVAGYVAKVLTP